MNRRSRRILLSAGTRVLISYLVLVVCSTVVSLVVIRQILIVLNEEQTRKSLVQEVEEFRRLVKGRNPYTGQPFRNDIATIFDVFLARNVPNHNEALITLLNGRLYKSSPTSLPASINPDSEMINYWAKLNQPKFIKKETPAGTFLYLAEPIVTTQGRGVFVVLNTDIYEREEVNLTIAVVGIVEAIMAAIALTSSVAWLATGRILTRLRLLTETARSISESDLTQRIPVRGEDEITELTITFNEMIERLEAAFTSQRDFIDDASHELRTPIAIVRGHLELLNDDPQEQRETLELVIDELDRMSRIVNDLLLLTKAEQPDFLNLETVQLESLTQELYFKATALGIRDWQLEALASGQIIGDRQRLTQAIMNLAQNATQHTDKNDIIALGSAITNSNAQFWVRDTGEGIALLDQKKIFKRFARGSHGRRRSEGAGLGLAIVQAIAQAHGGRVELISEPCAGSTFTIVIPVQSIGFVP